MSYRCINQLQTKAPSEVSDIGLIATSREALK